MEVVVANSFAAESSAHERRDDADLFFSKPVGFGDGVPRRQQILLGVVERQSAVTVPLCSRGMGLHGAIEFARCAIDLINADGGRGECRIGVADFHLRWLTKNFWRYLGLGEAAFKLKRRLHSLVFDADQRRG